MRDEPTAAYKRSAPFVRPLLAAALAVTASAPAVSQPVVVGYFLDLGNIRGESVATGHKGEIDVESWSMGFARQIPGGATGQQRTKGSVACDGVTVYKRVDKASVELLKALMNGIPIAKGTLTSIAPGDSRGFYTIVLGDIVVTSLRQSGPPIGPPEPGTFLLESVTLQPASYSFTYRLLDGTEFNSAGTCG